MDVHAIRLPDYLLTNSSDFTVEKSKIKFRSRALFESEVLLDALQYLFIYPSFLFGCF